MANVAIDLWPEDFNVPADEFPDDILKQQAEILGEKTNHLVEGQLNFTEDAKYLRDRVGKAFYLVAPKLGYRYRLFDIEYDIKGYPVAITDGDTLNIVCPNRDAFLDALKNIFASETTRRVIAFIREQTSR